MTLRRRSPVGLRLVPSPVFHVVSVPVAPSRVVRIPDHYPHEFASVPESWREITINSEVTTRLEYPALDPASIRVLEDDPPW